MAVTIIASVTYTPTTEVSYNRMIEVPPFVTCVGPNVPPWIGPIVSLGWNCNRCGSDQLFLNAFYSGDVIPFQTALDDQANTDAVNPTIGFKDSGTGIVAGTDFYARLELYDMDCSTVLADNADLICSDYWCAFSDKIGPIQTFFVDTSLAVFAGKDMFRLKMTTYDNLGAIVNESWTEVFLKEECKPTIRFQGWHNNDDCLSHQYKLPTTPIVGPSAPPAGSPTPFYMSWRWRGELIEEGTLDERVTNDNDDLLSTKQRRQFKIVFRNIPPYSKQIFDAVKSVSDVQIQRGVDDFETYQELGDVTKNIESGNRMFKIITTCTQICNIDEFDCDE